MRERATSSFPRETTYSCAHITKSTYVIGVGKICSKDPSTFEVSPSQRKEGKSRQPGRWHLRSTVPRVEQSSSQNGSSSGIAKEGKPLILILHRSKKSKKESSIYKNSAHGILKLHSGVSEGGRDDEGVSSGMNSSDHNSNNDKMGTRRKEFQKSAISLGLFKSKEKHTLCTI